MIILINDVIDAVTIALADEFGDEYTYYPQVVEQGFVTPSFMVNVLETTERRVVGNRYFKTIPLSIHCVSTVGQYTKNLNDIADRMYNCLELITMLNGDKLYGRNLQTDVDDSGDLVFMVVYSAYVYKTPDNPEDIDMNSLSDSVGVN